MNFLEKIFGKKNEKIDSKFYYALIAFNILFILIYFFTIIFLILPSPNTNINKLLLIISLIFSYIIINILSKNIYKNLSNFNLNLKNNKIYLIIAVFTIILAIFTKNIATIIVIPIFIIMLKFNIHMFNKTYMKDKKNKDRK